MEIWKDINGYEGIYQVSNLGNVKSIDRIQYIRSRWNNQLMKRGIKGKILKQGLGSTNYPIVSLSKNGEWITKPIHRLVAEIFIPNPENKPEVNHKNHDSTYNRVENLEWATRSENSMHSKYHDCVERRIDKKGFNLIVDLNTGIFYYSEGEASKAYGIKKTTLRMYLRGECRNKTSLSYA